MLDDFIQEQVIEVQELDSYRCHKHSQNFARFAEPDDEDWDEEDWNEDEEEEDSFFFFFEEDEGEPLDDPNRPIDPRWSALKNLN